MSTEGVRVAVFGATGAVGRDLLAALAESALPITDWRLIASRTTKEDRLEAGGEDRSVHRMPESLEDSPLLEDIDLAIFAAPPDVSARHAPVAAAAGVATIEIGGALAGKAPLVVPELGEEGLADFAETRLVSSPSAPALALAAVLSPLASLGVDSVRGTVLLSAGLAGRAGTEELGQQVLALFNSQDPPRAVFPSGLAFDLISQVGPLHEGWTGPERRIALETAALVPIQPEAIALTAVMMPLFAGVGLSLFVGIDPPPDIETVRHYLAEAPLLRLGDPVPGPRRLIGRGHVYVGRVRPDPLGQGVHLWAALDNIRAGASGNAVRIAERLWQEGLL